MNTEPDESGGETIVENDDMLASFDEGQAEPVDDSRMPSLPKQLWLVVAVALLITAAILLLLRMHPDAAFVTAALGLCAWFLNIRDGLKRKHGLRRRGRRNWESSGNNAD